jgi:hypothetical protein
MIERMRMRDGVFCSVVTYPATPPDVVQLRLVACGDHELADVPTSVESIHRRYAETLAEV